MPKRAESKLGEVRNNNFDTPMKIVKYVNINNITVEFQDEHKYVTNTTYQNFIVGKIKNPYDRRVNGVGYIGVGKYKSAPEKTRIARSYEVWRDMLERCYSEKHRGKHSTYSDCTICDEWHNYQSFAKWYEENYYEVNGERIHLDKDILVKGNKIYSPDTCIFVPQRINMIFMSKIRNTDSDLPAGIHRKASGYSAMYNTKSLGIYKTLDEAILIYNTKKRIHIKQVVEEYGERLPPKVRNALLNW